MKRHHPFAWSRRAFLHTSAKIAAGIPLAFANQNLFAEKNLPAEMLSNGKVAIVPCRTYTAAEVKAALKQSFDLIGGIQKLVGGKTATIKLNLTGTNFMPYLGRPVGETYMTHPTTVSALLSLLFDAGVKRVRLVESTQSKAELQSTLSLADWDVNALSALGKVEYENTRNLGSGKKYSHLRVPDGGRMFSSFELNHSYEETDVMISLCKLKNHVTAGVTLSMKNCFGLTPNTLYGDEAGTEDATKGRGPLHNPTGFEKIKLPGLKPDVTATEPFVRVPRIIADLCAARPIHLSIIDGITAMNGGEGPWTGQIAEIKMTTPGVLIVGMNPVSTDAVGTAVMGYDNPRAARGVKPFHNCENHLVLAEQAGLGTADLKKIDVRGMTIEKARYPYS